MSRQTGTETYGIMERSFVGVMTRRSASDEAVSTEETRGTPKEREVEEEREREGKGKGRRGTGTIIKLMMQ